VNRTMESAKWTGKLLLQIPVYLVTSYIARQLIGSTYNLLIKSGAALPLALLRQHFLILSFFGGLLAGILGLLALKVLMLFPFHAEYVYVAPWKRPQSWTWIIFTCVFLLGVLRWIVKNSDSSVLSSSSGISLAGFIDVFFGSGCQLNFADTHQSILNDCMNQITFTHPWLGTIGYSAAAFIPHRWLNSLHRVPSSEAELVAEDNKTDEQNPQERLAQ
jgi:hypothetical protein